MAGREASGLQYRSDTCRETFLGLGLPPSGLMMVTAIWYLSINNTESFGSLSWELDSFKEHLQRVWKPFRPARSVQSEKGFLYSAFSLSHKSEIIKKKKLNYSFYLSERAESVSDHLKPHFLSSAVMIFVFQSSNIPNFNKPKAISFVSPPN